MRKLTIAALPVVAVLAITLMMSGGVRTAHATTSCVEVYAQEYYVCLTLEPDTASNPVGTDHTVTATVTDGPSEVEQYPLAGASVEFGVMAGPNTGVMGTCDPASCETDAVGKVTFTYTDAAGVVETSDIIMGCHIPLIDEAQTAVRVIPEVCAEVEKDWFEPTPTPSPTPPPEPTPTPTATPAPEPTPTPSPAPVVAAVVEEPEALPETGGAPYDGGSSGLPWLAAIAGAIAMTSAGGLWFAYQRRRIR